MSISRLASFALIPFILVASVTTFRGQTKPAEDVPPTKTISPTAPTPGQNTARPMPTGNASPGSLDVTTVLAALTDIDPQIRRRAAYDVARIGSRSKEAIPALIVMLRDKDVTLQVAAASALGGLGPNAKDAVPALTEALSGDPSLRTAAMTAIGRIGTAAKSAAPALIGILGDDDEHVRLEAAAALRSIGQGKATVPALLELLKSTDEQIRLQAATALRPLGEKEQECRTVLTQLLESKLPHVREGAAREVEYYRSSAKDSLPALIDMLKDQSSPGYVREAAAHALGEIGRNEPKVKEALVAALNDKRKGVQKAVAAALKKVQ